jgi:selenide, water dikinase
MLFFGRKKRLLDYASAGRPGKLPAALAQAPGGAAPDTAIYQFSDDTALIQVVDLLAPIVNDPLVFGGIAAAHVLGAIYAAGAAPRIAYQLIGYPEEGEPVAGWLADIVRGGAEGLRAANVVVTGCQAVRDVEIKFGFAVSGIIGSHKIVASATARPGDKLVLTKALGSGVVSAAHKADACPEDLLQTACASMLQLNDIGRDAMLEVGAHAATVVKDLGLAGHAVEMATGSKVTLILDLTQLPVFPGAEKLARKPYLTRAGIANAAEPLTVMRKDGKLDPIRLEFCHDPQTSGGLLISVPAAEADILVQKCRGRGAQAAAIVGEVVEPQEVAVVLRA